MKIGYVKSVHDQDGVLWKYLISARGEGVSTNDIPKGRGIATIYTPPVWPDGITNVILSWNVIPSWAEVGRSETRRPDALWRRETRHHSLCLDHRLSKEKISTHINRVVENFSRVSTFGLPIMRVLWAYYGVTVLEKREKNYEIGLGIEKAFGDESKLKIGK